VVGLALILALVFLAVGAVIAMPPDEAVRLWRGDEATWIETPRNALPGWVNLIPGVNLPETIVRGQGTGNGSSNPPPPAPDPQPRERSESDSQAPAPAPREIDLAVAFEYPYDDYPSEVALFFQAGFDQRQPLASVLWVMPDGRRVSLGEHIVGATTRYVVSQDQRLSQRLGGLPPEVGLFTGAESRGSGDRGQGTGDRAGDREGPPTPTPPLKGRYEIAVQGLLFEEASRLDVKLVVYGKVHGVAGTDHRRRDLSVALLWGTPVALAFGLLAAVGSSATTLVIAAAGAWWGGWIDAAIQRVTEVNAILPALPILILITTFYSRSLWVILIVVILLNIFGLGIKFYRAFFLQVRESPYIEAARAYGAGGGRIIFYYMIPRVLPLLAPGFVTAIPGFVFLETSLAFLGLGDPSLPTWGKILNDAYQNGALYKGYYYWVLQPSALLMLTGLSFAMLGFALDRVFNPRLRVQ